MKNNIFSYGLITSYATVLSLTIPSKESIVYTIMTPMFILVTCFFLYLFLKECFDDKPTLDDYIRKGCVSIGYGWNFVRDNDKESEHYGSWFIENPSGTWIAHFWDGEKAGEEDVRLLSKYVFNVRD